jgi:type II secretory pathway pseudopilin PulG
MAFAYPNAAAPMPNVALPYPTYNVYQPAQLKTGLATASLVIGILNFLFFGMFLIPIIVGIVISVVALNRIKRSPHEYGGRSLAIGGLVTNIVSVVVLVPIMLIAAIAIPNLFASVRAANEGSAISSLRTIHEAEVTYQRSTGNLSYGNLSDLKSLSLISPELSSGAKHGYRFTVEWVTDRGDGRPGYSARAVPITYRSSGIRSFFIDETGVLRGEDSHGLEASKFAPPISFNRDYSDSRSSGRRTSQNAGDPY